MTSTALGQNTHCSSGGQLAHDVVDPLNASQMQALMADDAWYHQIIPAQSLNQAENSNPFELGIPAEAGPTQPYSDFQFTWHPDNKDVPPTHPGGTFAKELHLPHADNSQHASLVQLPQGQFNMMDHCTTATFAPNSSASGSGFPAMFQKPNIAHPSMGHSTAARPNSAPVAVPATNAFSAYPIPPRPSTSGPRQPLMQHSSRTFNRPNVGPRLRVHPSAVAYQSGPLNLRAPITSASTSNAVNGFPFPHSSYPMNMGNYASICAGIPPAILNVNANVQFPGMIPSFPPQYHTIPNGFPIAKSMLQHSNGLSQGMPPMGQNTNWNFPDENVYSQPMVPPTLFQNVPTQNIPIQSNLFSANEPQGNRTNSNISGQSNFTSDIVTPSETGEKASESETCFIIEGPSSFSGGKAPKSRAKGRQPYKIPPRFRNTQERNSGNSVSPSRPSSNWDSDQTLNHASTSSSSYDSSSSSRASSSDTMEGDRICLWKSCGMVIPKPASISAIYEHLQEHHFKGIKNEKKDAVIFCEWFDYDIKQYNKDKPDEPPICTAGSGKAVTCWKTLRLDSMHKHVGGIHLGILEVHCPLCSARQARPDNMWRHLTACRLFKESGEAEQRSVWKECVKGQKEYDHYFINGRLRAPEERAVKRAVKVKRGGKSRQSRKGIP